mmetsp:Transcript_18938/g.57217  ORF Transcript_18938/g.57217 Transcript_18938/m.57217 type:complete len:748 (+) Transcript_18938:3-2246(+)
MAGADLVGGWCHHPLSGRRVPILLGEHVSDDAGTGLVHTAPAHGVDDFHVGVAHGLSLTCAVDEAGCYTDAIDEASAYAGAPVLGEGGRAVLHELERRGALLASNEYRHRYPYDWRAHSPVVFRATPQWFASVDALRAPALCALAHVDMVPAAGRSRLEAFVKGRAEWCLSRQRPWGVPLPAFYHVSTGEVLLTSETVAHVADLVELHGSDAWWTLPTAELLPPSRAHEAALWMRGTDTLDVWFDSGCSWAALAARRGLAPPQAAGAPVADIYLEGSDQHRGWFQSSLLTRVASAQAQGAGEARSAAPFARVVTHGFVVDEFGVKMSKSRGNVIRPMELIDGVSSLPDGTAQTGTSAHLPAPTDDNGRSKHKQPKTKAKGGKAKGGAMASPPVYGADVLRLWVAMSDWRGDVAVGPTILSKTAEVHRKLRNSCRFMLGNLYDYDSVRHAPAASALRAIDRQMLHTLATFSDRAHYLYERLDTPRLVSEALQLASVELSSSYFDSVRDRLYCAPADSPSRRAAQHVLDRALDTLTTAIAPVLPFLAEEVHAHLPAGSSRRISPSPFELLWSAPPAAWSDDRLAHDWKLVCAARDEAAKLAHEAVLSKRLGSMSEARIELRSAAGGPLHSALLATGYELNDVLLCCASRVDDLPTSNATAPGGAADGDTTLLVDALVTAGGGTSGVAEEALAIRIYAPDASIGKCPRCWRHVHPQAVSGEGIALADGWTYRGCPTDGAADLCYASHIER